MPKGLFIHGNAQRFMFDSCMRPLLVGRLGISPRLVRCMSTTYVDMDILEYRIAEAVRQKTKEPLLISYVGHGAENGWALDDVRIYPYMRLAMLLLFGKRPVTIVSDTCHAMSAVIAFEICRVSPERVSLIGACDAKDTTNGGFCRDVAYAWQSGKRPDIPDALRWGADHDHFYFPPAQAAAKEAS